MAKTVSRSGDNGSSTPVNVPYSEGHFEEHRADAADLSAARVSPQTSFKGMQDIVTANWIENLMTSASNFTSDKGSFKLRPNGVHGSVQTITEELKRDSFVLRAVQRGRIRFLSDEEANARINELVDEESQHDDHLEHLMESLGANASENNGLYKPGVRDEAEQNGPAQTPAEIWAGRSKPQNIK
jgi:hypothetical protein